MYCVAERIKNGGYFQRYRMRMFPYIHHGHHNVLSECTRAVHADSLDVSAKVPSPGKAVTAASADHVAFSADNIARMVIAHIRAYFDDLTHEFVANHQGNRNGRARPFIPFVNVNIRAANAGKLYANLNVIDADLRLGHVFQPQAPLTAAFYKSFHAYSFSGPKNIILVSSLTSNQS